MGFSLKLNRVCKNGSGKKTIKAPTGSFELATPRDRNGTFEPQLFRSGHSKMQA
ncbi:Transposase, Mutator family [Kosakonia oryziphila]|uniref:Transposase, Mutator family n=1 Tax=Kosakonia oryziphila TaxID=1005667 RepID=A0A1C4GIP5_9ENTR|nr:Transposase, Mutator family [Kosakonia oryziphila]